MMCEKIITVTPHPLIKWSRAVQCSERKDEHYSSLSLFNERGNTGSRVMVVAEARLRVVIMCLMLSVLVASRDLIYYS